jgi:NDP-sugar pyrophosphorylase family protein
MPPFPQQAIVLAAGLGTRLLPLTKKMPKPILPVGGIPILLFNLFLLKEAGVSHITMNLHHRPEKIRRLLKNFRRLGLQLRYSLEPRILGTAGGIAQALSKMKKTSTFVLNGDILYDLDLKAMNAVHRRHQAQATLACVPIDRAPVHSYVEFDHKGKIYRIAGEPKPPHPIPPLRKAIFSGVHLVEPEIFVNYPLKSFGCVIRKIYQPALATGKNLHAYYHEDSWWDLGSLAELKKVDLSLWCEKAEPHVLKFWKEVGKWCRPLFDNA